MVRNILSLSLFFSFQKHLKNRGEQNSSREKNSKLLNVILGISFTCEVGFTISFRRANGRIGFKSRKEGGKGCNPCRTNTVVTRMISPSS